MKNAMLAIALFMSLMTSAQDSLRPGKRVVRNKWVRNGSYVMDWFLYADTVKQQLGSVATLVKVEGGEVLAITHVSLQRSTGDWVDSTIAEEKTLRPKYHSSYNPQRDMVLRFGSVVSGYYHDKQKQERIAVSDTVGVGYFDSNLYPLLIGWLPLRKGYSAIMKIYDFNPTASRKGLLHAWVRNVSLSTYTSTRFGERTVWIVEVSDELGNDPNAVSRYYIDKKNHRLWMQEINTGGRKMAMVLREN